MARGAPMEVAVYHHVARARAGQLLFDTWAEGLRVWEAVLAAAPAPIALCVMPNHVHLLTASSVRGPLGRSLSGLARSWNARHSAEGPLFDRTVQPGLVARDKRRRVHRYVILNPVRAGLTDDALAWPLTTFADEVGLADGPVRGRVDDVYGHHGYVVADDRVRVRDLPFSAGGPVAADRLVAAVSQATRTPLLDVTGRSGRARVLLVRSARSLNGWGVRRAARELGLPKSTVGDVVLVPDRGVEIVARLAVSPSIVGLDDFELRRAIARTHYRRLAAPGRR